MKMPNEIMTRGTLIKLIPITFLSIILLSLDISCIGQPGSPQTPGLPSIGGQVTFLYYDDLSEADEFYGKILQFEKTFDEGWVKIYKVSGEAYLGVVDSQEGFHSSNEDKAVMFSIVTSEVDNWYKYLKDIKVALVSDISNSEKVPVRAFIVEDPGGYSIEFFQWIKTKNPEK